MRHRRPVPVSAVNAFMRRRVRHPTRARALARHPVGSEKRFHAAMLVMRGPMLVMSSMFGHGAVCVFPRRRMSAMPLMALRFLDRRLLSLLLRSCLVLGVLGRRVLRMIHGRGTVLGV